MTPRNLSILVLMTVVWLTSYAKAVRNRYAGTLSESISTISQLYVEPVPTRKLFESALHGMLQPLDPNSVYIPPEMFRQFQVELNQKFTGIGIVVELDTEAQQLTVLSPIPDSPAHRAGLISGDRILEIDGVSTRGFTPEDAAERIRGLPGTQVRLLVLHPGTSKPREYTVRREVVPIESVLGDFRLPDGKWSYVLEANQQWALVRIVNFGEETADELERVLVSLKDRVQGLIVDVRGNEGGLLDAAVEVADLFLPQGKEIVTTRGRGGTVLERYAARRPPVVAPALPLVVLVDRTSASASEIVAACLQDHSRAEIVGERTWGKGTVQHVIPIEGGRSALKLTTATYWRPSGRDIDRARDEKEDDDWGVQPKPEYRVSLGDDEYQQWLLARRRRDIVPPAHQASAKPAAIVDRILERAVDYLQTQASHD